MEKLTLEHIAPYLPYGLTSYETNYKWNREVVAGIIEQWNMEKSITVFQILSDKNGFIPILRPMSDLTKPITIDGKEVIPIVELAKIFNNMYDWKFDNNIKEAYTGTGGYFGYNYKNDFYITERKGFPFRHLTNQLTLFKWLYANKFDVDGLIEKGLAINCCDLETNPY